MRPAVRVLLCTVLLAALGGGAAHAAQAPNDRAAEPSKDKQEAVKAPAAKAPEGAGEKAKEKARHRPLPYPQT
jgi:hypothetical protein